LRNPSLLNSSIRLAFRTCSNGGGGSIRSEPKDDRGERLFIYLQKNYPLVPDAEKPDFITAVEDLMFNLKHDLKVAGLEN
jgi:hypothetical protein